MDIPTVVVTGAVGVVVGAMLDMLRVAKKFQTVIDEIRASREQADARFGQVDAKFGQIDAKFGRVDLRFGEVRADIRHLDQKIDRVAHDVADIRERVAVLETATAS